MRNQFLNDDQSRYCIVIERLKIKTLIGILDFEKEKPQEIEVSVRAFSDDEMDLKDYGDYISYSAIVERIQRETKSLGHVELVESYAEHIADCLLEDERVSRIVIEVIKTEIMPETDGVGVLIDRRRPSLLTSQS